MKTLILTLLFSINITANNCEHLVQVRNIFQAGMNKKQLEKMILICEKATCPKIIPYHAAAIMKKADFVWSVFKKLSNFKKGKKMLEDFIKKNPEDVEARYIRWLTQKMVPKFLGYNNNIKEDYLFIQDNIVNSNIDKDYQKVIFNHIKKIKNE